MDSIAPDRMTQLQLAIEQKYHALEETRATFATLEAKALGLLQTGGLVTTIQGGLAFIGPTACVETCAKWLVSFTLLAIALLAIMVWRLLDSLRTKTYEIPGNTNIDLIHAAILDRTPDEAAYIVLRQASSAVETALRLNLQKAKAISEGARLLVALLIVVLITVAIRVFGG